MSKDHRNFYKAVSNEETRKKLANFEGRVFNPNDKDYEVKEALKGVMPKDATLSPKTANTGFFGASNFIHGGGGGGSAMFHAQRPYLPEYESPDRYYFPKDRLEANRYWRMFYRDDPMFGTAVDMYSQMMFSDFDIIFDNDSDKAVSRMLEDMCQEVGLLNSLQNMVKEYLVIGEAFPNLFFNKEKGIWSALDLLDPDHIEVIDAPLIDMDPILNLIPTEDMVSLFSDNSKEAKEIQARFPQGLVSKIRSKQKLRLSNKNTSYIPRKMHPYDNRGTSLATRLWRTFMIEDAVANSTIAMFRRHASPLKIVKLGDPTTGYIPDPSEEQKVAKMLSQMELDPQSYFIYNYAIDFSTTSGNQERTVTLSREFDTIEKLKLLALGLSKSFMTGEVSFACLPKDFKLLQTDGSYKNICDIEKGQLVVDRFGEHKKVVDTFKYDSPDELVEITLRGNKTLRATTNHKFPVFARPRKCLCGCGTDLPERRTSSQGLSTWSCFKSGHSAKNGFHRKSREWEQYKHGEYTSISFPEEHNPYVKLEAKDIKVGDYLMIPRKFEKSNTPVNETTLKMARLLGYYVAEGNVLDVTKSIGSKSARFSFGITEKEKFLAEDVISMANDLDLKCKLSIGYGNKHTVNFSTQSSDFAKWLEDNGGKYSEHKCLSQEVMGWDLELKKELIKGMYRGDGTLSQHSDHQFDVIYTTISETLTEQLELILAQLGYYSYRVGSPPKVHKDGYKRKKCYQVQCSGLQNRSLASLIWEDVPLYWGNHVIQERYNMKPGQGTKITCHCDDNYLYIPIKSVKMVPVDKEKDPYVYSIEVEDSHSYVVNNIASFNSAKSGLQVFLRRLLSMRQFLESMWIYPKFLEPIIEVNNIRRRTPAELNHRVRVRKESREDELVRPKIVWKNSLDPKVDLDLLQAYGQLKNYGFPISETTMGNAVSIDPIDEAKKKAVEFIEKEKVLKKTLGDHYYNEFKQEEAAKGQKPPGQAGSGAKPVSGGPPGKVPPGQGTQSAPPGSNEGGGSELGDNSPLSDSITKDLP